MQIIYRAKDIADAHILSGFLQSHGIECHVGGHYLQGAIGEIGMADFALVRVADEDTERARQLVLEYEQSDSSTGLEDLRQPSDMPSPLLVIATFLVSVFILVVLVS